MKLPFFATATPTHGPEATLPRCGKHSLPLSNSLQLKTSSNFNDSNNIRSLEDMAYFRPSSHCFGCDEAQKSDPLKPEIPKRYLFDNSSNKLTKNFFHFPSLSYHHEKMDNNNPIYSNGSHKLSNHHMDSTNSERSNKLASLFGAYRNSLRNYSSSMKYSKPKTLKVDVINVGQSCLDDNNNFCRMPSNDEKFYGANGKTKADSLTNSHQDSKSDLNFSVKSPDNCYNNNNNHHTFEENGMATLKANAANFFKRNHHNNKHKTNGERDKILNSNNDVDYEGNSPYSDKGQNKEFKHSPYLDDDIKETDRNCGLNLVQPETLQKSKQQNCNNSYQHNGDGIGSKFYQKPHASYYLGGGKGSSHENSEKNNTLSLNKRVVKKLTENLGHTLPKWISGSTDHENHHYKKPKNAKPNDKLLQSSDDVHEGNNGYDNHYDSRENQLDMMTSKNRNLNLSKMRWGSLGRDHMKKHGNHHSIAHSRDKYDQHHVEDMNGLLSPRLNIGHGKSDNYAKDNSSHNKEVTERIKRSGGVKLLNIVPKQGSCEPLDIRERYGVGTRQSQHNNIETKFQNGGDELAYIDHYDKELTNESFLHDKENQNSAVTTSINERRSSSNRSPFDSSNCSNLVDYYHATKSYKDHDNTKKANDQPSYRLDEKYNKLLTATSSTSSSYKISMGDKNNKSDTGFSKKNFYVTPTFSPTQSGEKEKKEKQTTSPTNTLRARIMTAPQLSHSHRDLSRISPPKMVQPQMYHIIPRKGLLNYNTSSAWNNSLSKTSNYFETKRVNKPVEQPDVTMSSPLRRENTLVFRSYQERENESNDLGTHIPTMEKSPRLSNKSATANTNNHNQSNFREIYVERPTTNLSVKSPISSSYYFSDTNQKRNQDLGRGISMNILTSPNTLSPFATNQYKHESNTKGRFEDGTDDISAMSEMDTRHYQNKYRTINIAPRRFNDAEDRKIESTRTNMSPTNESPNSFVRNSVYSHSLDRRGSWLQEPKSTIVYLKHKNETKRYSFTPPEKNLTTLDDVRKAYMQIFPNQFTMHFLRYNCCIYIQDMDNPREIFYELEDVSDITNKSVLKLVHHNTNDKDTVVDTRNYTPDSVHSTSSSYHHSSEMDRTETNYPSFVDSLSRTHSKATSYDTTIDSTITNTDQDMLSEKSSICSSTMNQNMLQRDGYRENSYHKNSTTSGGKETQTNSYSKTPTKLIDASYYSEPEYDCRKYKKILPTNQSPNRANKERNTGINKFAPMYASQIVKSPYHMDRKLSNSMINSTDTRYNSERPLAGQLVLSSKENIANMSTKFNKQKQILDMMEAKLKSRNLFNTPGKDDIYRTSNNDICWESSDSKMKMETMEKRLNALTAMVQNVLRGTSVDFGDELAQNNFLILKTLHDKALQLKFDFKLLKKSTRNYNYDMQDLMHQTKQRLNIVCQYVPSYAIPKISQSLANFAVCENNFDHFGTEHEGNMSDFDGQVAFLLKHIEDYRHDMAKLEKTLNDIEISIEEFKNDLEHVNYEYKKMDADSIAIALNFANRAATDLKSRYTKLERKLIIGIDCSRNTPADGMNQINFNKERQIFIKIEPEKLRNNLNRCRKLNKVIITIKDALREEITDIEEYIRNRTQKLSRSPSNQSLTSMLSNRSTYQYSKHILNGNPVTSKNNVWENCNKTKLDHLSRSCMNVIDEPLDKLVSLYEQQKSHIPYTFSYVNRKKSVGTINHDENIDIMSRSLDNWRSSRDDIGSKIPIEASRSTSNYVKEPRIKSRLPLLTLPEKPELFFDNNYNDHIDRHYQTAPSQTSELNLSSLRKKDYCEDDTISSNYNMACGSQSYITTPSESPNNFSLRSNRTSPEVSVKTSLKGQKLLNNQNLVTNGTNPSSPVIGNSLIHMEVHRKQPYEIKVERVKMTPKMTDHANVDRQTINVNSVTTETEKTNGLINGKIANHSHTARNQENILDNGREDHRAHHKDNNAKKSLTISEKRKRNYTLTPSNSNVYASSKLPLNLNDIFQHHTTDNDIFSEKMDKKDCGNDNKSVSSGRISTMSTRSDSYLNQSINRAILVSESASRPLDENDSPNPSGIRNVLGKRDKFEKIIEDHQQDINQHLSSVRSSHSHSQSPLLSANEGVAGSNSQIPLPPIRKFIKAGQQANTLSSIRSPIMSPVSGNLSPIKEMSPLSSQNNLLNCTNNIADTAPQNNHYNNDNYESCRNLSWKYGQEGINGALNVKENNRKQESVTAEQIVSTAEMNGFHSPAQEMIAKVHDPATLRALTMSPTQATIINLKDKINRIYDHIHVPNNIESDKEQQADSHIYEKPACSIHSQDIGNDVSFNNNDNKQSNILPTTTLPNKNTNLGPKAFWQNQESATLNAYKQSDMKTGSTRALNVVSPPPSHNPLTEMKCGQSQIESQSYVGHDLNNISIGHNYQNGCLLKEDISYDTSSLIQLNASSHFNDKNLKNENQKLLIAPQAPPLPKLSSASSYSTQTLASAETGFPSPSKIPIRTSNNNNVSNIMNNKYMSSSTKTLKGDVENLNGKNNFLNVYSKVVGARASNPSNNVTKGTYWKEFANLQRQIAAEAALAKQNKKSAPYTKQYSGSSGKENLSTPYPEKPLTVKTVQQPYLNNLIRNSNNETTSLNSFSTKINNNLPNGNDDLNASSISSYYRPSELSDSRCSLNSSVLGLSGFGTESNYSVPIIYDEPNNNFMHDKTNKAPSDCMNKTSSLLPEENIYSTIDGSHYGLQENSVNNFSTPTHNHSNLELNNNINNDFNGNKYTKGNNSKQMYENISKNDNINNGMQKNRETIKNTHHLNGNNHFSDDSKPLSVIDSVSDNDCMFVTTDESKRDLTQSDNEILDGNPRKKIVYVVDGKKDNMVTNFQSNGSSNLMESKSNPIGDSKNGVPEYHEFESNKKTKKQPQNPVKMGTLIHHKTPD